MGFDVAEIVNPQRLIIVEVRLGDSTFFKRQLCPRDVPDAQTNPAFDLCPNHIRSNGDTAIDSGCDFSIVTVPLASVEISQTSAT